MELIRVYANSPVNAVAGAITGVVHEYHQAEVQAIGAEAVNQAIQGLALATDCLKDEGIYVNCVPQFCQVTVENKVRTAIKLVVKPYSNAGLSPTPKRVTLV